MYFKIKMFPNPGGSEVTLRFAKAPESVKITPANVPGNEPVTKGLILKR